ncbi:MAG: 1-acyl-sn-glycerol-3-phosphate acyltransferase [bacterium]
MLRWLSKLILRLFGWHTDGSLPEGLTRVVIISAPHTSLWDFVIGRLTFWAIRINIRFLIKSEAFRPPWGFFMKRLGGIPVERGTRNRMVDQVAKMFSDHDSLAVVITPEGTRQLVTQWKKGFYLIAMRANVPIALSYINYGDKTGGIGPILNPTGDYDKDLEFIQEFYRDKVARHPDRFSLSYHQRKYQKKRSLQPEDPSS